ncbi:MAG TPA: hypothetical protein PKA77_13885 [Chitinophagaceae bacterium]|jgi:uncharacterized membrane protein|nr:hypothetical protein [Chitinophagaceae bacterium]HMU58085.1 hypothetical protein [Chitinophagaceae bacterium]
MNKFVIIAGLLSMSFLLVYCNPSKKAAKTVVKTGYANDISALVVSNCSPCHIPANGGKKKPYDSYANVKTDIDEIIRRIELNPGEKGFMPMRKTTKLSDSVIAVFKKWKEDGLGE